MLFTHHATRAVASLLWSRKRAAFNKQREMSPNQQSVGRSRHWSRLGLQLFHRQLRQTDWSASSPCPQNLPWVAQCHRGISKFSGWSCELCVAAIHSICSFLPPSFATILSWLPRSAAGYFIRRSRLESPQRWPSGFALSWISFLTTGPKWWWKRYTTNPLKSWWRQITRWPSMKGVPWSELTRYPQVVFRMLWHATLGTRAIWRLGHRQAVLEVNTLMPSGSGAAGRLVALLPQSALVEASRYNPAVRSLATGSAGSLTECSSDSPGCMVTTQDRLKFSDQYFWQLVRNLCHCNLTSSYQPKGERQPGYRLEGVLLLAPST